jgi:solute:Na+ symporter, SSS family
MVLCAAVSLVTRPKPDADLVGLIWNWDSLSLPADQRAQYRGLRSPFLWWALITGVVLYFYIRFP